MPVNVRRLKGWTDKSDQVGGEKRGNMPLTRGQKKLRENLQEGSINPRGVGVFLWTTNFNRPHPLLIPDVVSNIVGNLEVADLKKCRLVCKEFQMQSWRALPKVGKIFLKTFEDMEEFINDHQDDRYKFTWFKLGPDLNLQSTVMQRFFNKFGPDIEHLHLDWTHWIPASLRKLLFEKLPKLEELILCSQRLAESIRFLPATGRGPISERKCIPNIKILRVQSQFETMDCVFLLDLVSVLPNLILATGYRPKSASVTSAPKYSKLESLRYDQCDSTTDQSLNIPSPQLIFSRLMYKNPNELLKGRLNGIKSLSLIFDVDNFNLFREGSLALESLEISIPHHTFSSWHPRPSHLSAFIVSFCTTLKQLKLNFSPSKLRLFSAFDGINRLKHLQHITLNRVSGSLDFLNGLPHLKSLHMTQEDYVEYYDEFHPEESCPHTSLQSLKLFYTNWSASSVYSELPRPAKMLHVVETLVQRFPNLKTLRMESLTDKCLGVIFQNYPNLEELEATNGSFTSAGITGVPVVNQGTFDSRKNPHIGLVKNLKRLRLESNKMTDYAIRSSITNIKSLEELTLLCYKLNDESLFSIVEKLNLSLLKTEFCYEFTPEAITVATRFMKSRGATVALNAFCGSLDIESVHDFLNENGPVHISIPEFPTHL